MSARQRLTFAAIAAAIAVAAAVLLVALGGEDESEPEAAAPVATATATPAEPSGTATATATPESTPEPTPEPPPRIRYAGGEVAGGMSTLRFEQGERARFTITSDVPEEIHVHGYDLYADVGPGSPASFSFPADITGIFEIEMHGSGTQVASLRVDP